MKTSPCTRSEARTRLHIADAYLQSASQILDGRATDGAFLNVAAGLAILAGIAASDAICGARLAKIHRGQNHREAEELLRGAAPDGRALANGLARLLVVRQVNN